MRSSAGRRSPRAAWALHGDAGLAGGAIVDARASQVSGTGALDAGDAGPSSSGSGVVVDGDGRVLTNRHVVEGCSRLRVRGDAVVPTSADIVALDDAADLALLRASAPLPFAAVFRAGSPLRAGEDVLAVGFPLAGLLADEANVSAGLVNALAGLRNDRRVFQMSAPVQQGSSGGPLLDAGGRVVGLVVTRLNSRVVAEETGDFPQNVNFALKSEVARAFAERAGATITLDSTSLARPRAEVADEGRRVTVMVECWRGSPGAASAR